MPTNEERIQQLIKRGIMPTEAEQIVADVDGRNGALLTPNENAQRAVFGDADIEADKLWVFYTPDIPDEFRRLWTARTVK